MSAVVSLLVFVATGVVVTFVGYWVHRFFHSPASRKLHDTHMNHHLVHYPPMDFWSDKYRSAGLTSSVIPFILAFSPLVGGVLAATLVGMVSCLVGISVLASIALWGLVHDYIHDQFHLNDTWLARFGWFVHLRARHHIHHLDMNMNYGILVFWWDKMFGTIDHTKII